MAKQTRSALGRGLDALITMDEIKTNGTSSINEVPLSKIQANPDQPRTFFDQEALEELASSIKHLGLVQPITLRESADGTYQIISGERRYRASKLAGLETIPAYIKKASDENMMEMALIENIQREDLDPIEIALAFQNLIETYQLTQDKLSERIGKKRATIANFLRLLKLPAEIQMGLKDKKIDMGHAKAMLGATGASSQLAVYEQVVKEGHSVRKTEELVRELNLSLQADTPTKKKKNESQMADFAELREALSAFFGSKVGLSCNDRGQGKISIAFSSEKDLERIIMRLDALQK